MRLEVNVRDARGVAPATNLPELWRAPALFPFGFGTWMTFAYLGVRARRKDWLLASAGYFGAIVVGLLVATVGEEPSLVRTLIGFGIWTATWFGGIFHMRRIRHEARARVGTARAADVVREENERRRSAIALAAREPETARQLGIGSARDLHDYGLVDVNAATAEELAKLPGIDRQAAQRIVVVRERGGGFSSIAELGHDAELSADAVERLTDRVVFLPTDRA